MHFDPTDYAGRTYDAGSFAVEPWIVHLWREVTGRKGNVEGRSTDEESELVPPELGALIAREAAATTELEADLRREVADADVFLGGHRFRFERPIRVGVTYRACAEIADVTEKAGESGAFFVLTVEYDVTDVDGTEVYEMETDLVVREADA